MDFTSTHAENGMVREALELRAEPLVFRREEIEQFAKMDLGAAVQACAGMVRLILTQCALLESCGLRRLDEKEIGVYQGWLGESQKESERLRKEAEEDLFAPPEPEVYSIPVYVVYEYGEPYRSVKSES